MANLTSNPFPSTRLPSLPKSNRFYQLQEHLGKRNFTLKMEIGNEGFGYFSGLVALCVLHGSTVSSE